MRAEHFLNNVQLSAPSLRTLEDFGLDQDEIEEIRLAFQCQRKPDATDDGPFRNELERMLHLYDCSNLEIGLIRFSSDPRRTVAGVAIGCVEADPLIVHDDGQVATYDHADEQEMMLPCARTAEHFLEALSTFLHLRIEEGSRPRNARMAAELCAHAAGGLQYLSFYEVLCSPLYDRKRL